MLYFDFSGTFARGDLLAKGAALTLALSAAAMILSMTVGLLGAIARRSRNRILRGVVIVYVETIRNTPFLVQIYLVYFGLPALGIRLDAVTASILALTIYAGAYVTEILRAGIETVDSGQVEAARALGLSRFLIFRHVILTPALAAIYPALTSQFILLMLASSVCSAISTPELAGAAADIQGLTFRAFEAFIVVAAVYLAFTLMFRTAFARLDRVVFRFRHAGR